MAVPTPNTHEFGPFRLEVTERRLSRQGRPVPLQDKLFVHDLTDIHSAFQAEIASTNS